MCVFTQSDSIRKEFLDLIPAVEEELQQKSERIYEQSFVETNGDKLVISKFGLEKYALIIGDGQLYRDLAGKSVAGC